MIIPFFKYQGAGNDFIIIDNRSKEFQLNTIHIQKLCNRHFGIGADGLMLLEKSHTADFKMVYFNSDGKESTMCGNGGRCIVAFAKQLNIIQQHATFEAIDGMHYAEILENNKIRLQIQNVSKIEGEKENYTLNTGSPHYVKIVDNLNTINVIEEGRKIRYSDKFKQQGINVNFMQIVNNTSIAVRTYERGVENETLACGTGVTACAIVLEHIRNEHLNKITVHTLGGELLVEYTRQNNTFKDIFLTGNADFVFKGEIDIKFNHHENI